MGGCKSKMFINRCWAKYRWSLTNICWHVKLTFQQLNSKDHYNDDSQDGSGQPFQIW